MDEVIYNEGIFSLDNLVYFMQTLAPDLKDGWQIEGATALLPNPAGGWIKVALTRTTNGTTTYIIQKGDSSWKIAQKYGTTVDILKSLNPQILDMSKIKPNDLMTVPAPLVETKVVEIKLA